MLVLVAHTDRWTRLLVSDVVAGAGCSVVEASNGMSALRLAQRTQPDLVLLGPMLAEIDSPDVVGMLREDTRTRSMPVLMLRHADQGRCSVPIMRVQCARVRRPRRPARRRVRVQAASATALVRSG